MELVSSFAETEYGDPMFHRTALNRLTSMLGSLIASVLVNRLLFLLARQMDTFSTANVTKGTKYITNSQMLTPVTKNSLKLELLDTKVDRGVATLEWWESIGVDP
ncbi:hypothetical protein JTE90_014831 [Oedothorax gibbosus]|uniref:Uncharacterized protein n=1 Tax=Oedothorax gibbosus TaxID=931172 RepID=A0AAV6TU27_9ARAC|nr:hypothetical protein JTE90_014831 [Oedothorax gibbosus]